MLLVALALEAVLVFRPAVRWLRSAIGDQERLREQEAINRELSAAAEAARRIGYDLHDGVGQTLTALTLQAKAVEAGVPATAAPAIAALREGIADALAQTRAAAACLAPIDVRVEGLPDALKRLADATSRAAGVDCRADCLPITAPSSEDLFRIAQEAVANAMRHGEARAIRITLADEHGAGLLAVCDDGRGVSQAGEGVGMRSMRWRAERIGGSLSAGPRPEGGWRVECRFPLRKAAS